MIARQLMRNFTTSAIRSSHTPGGIPGSNLPFSVSNRFVVTLSFTLFLGSAFAIPFLMVRHQMLK